MIPLSPEEAGRALGLDPLPAPVGRVCTDSRQLQAGDLFVALRGERFDGHDFALEALSVGAAGAVVDQRWWAERRVGMAEAAAVGENRLEARVYVVDDTLAALGSLAREVRRKSSAKVVAVTGSAGKTSTKDLVAAMAAEVSTVVATAQNQNNEVGVPLTLLRMTSKTGLAVVEMGMRGKGQIDALARIAEPDVGVVTNIHPVHLELLGTLENIAEVKAELVARLRNGAIGVIPADCPLLDSHAAAASCRILRFGFGPDPGNRAAATGVGAADMYGWLDAEGAEETTLLHLRWPEGEAEVEVPFCSRHLMENAVAAATACYAAGLPVERCLRGLSRVQLSESRGEVLRLSGLVVIDDTYNSNPAAARAALAELVRLAGRSGGRAVAVLGDMLELGPDAERYHREVGAYAAELGVSALWGVGPLSEATVEGFRRAWETGTGAAVAGAACTNVAFAGAKTILQAGNVESAAEASPILAGLRPGDLVLLKASRSMRLELLVNRIVEEASAGVWAGPAGSVDVRGSRSASGEGPKR